MLKRLGFCFTNKLATESFKLPDHVTTKEVCHTCFHESETTKECINLKAFPVKSNSSPSVSLSVTYQNDRRFRNGDLAGHIISLPLQLPDPTILQVLDYEIPNLFLVTEEIFREHVTMVLSESCLSSSIQERLLTLIFGLEDIRVRSTRRRGFMIKVEIKVEMDHSVEIGCSCKGKEACPLRVFGDRHVAERVTGTDCPICLTELSSAVSRMELRCSHVFHTNCVMKWLENNISCPICRVQALGEIFIY